jgi:hypothetical protein
MSTEEIQGGSASNSDEGSALREEATEQVINADGYQKKNRELLAELKKEREAKAEFQKQLDAIETQKLADSGQKDELIKRLQTQLSERETKLKESTNTFAMKTVKAQFSDAARAMGCEKPHLALKLANLADVSVSTDDFSVDADSIKAALEAVKDEAPELFRKNVPAPRDGTPSTSAIRGSGSVTAESSLDELKAAFNRLPR